MRIRRPTIQAALAAAVLVGPSPLPGQADAALPDGFQDELVVDGLAAPTSLAFLPDGRILVVEQKSGNVRLVRGAAPNPDTLLTIPDVNPTGNERGLLGVAVDPGWPARPYTYFLFTRTPGNVSYIVRYTVSGDLADSASTNLAFGSRYDIITDIPDNAQNHNGGTLRFGLDGMLYASLGEDAYNCQAQDSTDLRGVVLRLDVAALPDTGSGPPAKSLITPPDNPFPPANANAGLTFCFGLRNPFRFHVDRVTGKLYLGDVGQSTYEELDEVSGGENFGWPYREGPLVRVPTGCSEPGGSGSQTYDDPIFYYDRPDPGPAAVIGGPRYRPVPGGFYSFPPLYDGALFFSDYYGGFLRVIRETAGTWATLDSVPGQPNATDWATGFDYVADYLEGPDGAVYYVKQVPGALRRLVFMGDTSGIGDERPSARLLTVRPNPFRSGRGGLTLELAQGLASREVLVYALDGSRVRVLAPAESGERLFIWDGRNDEGRPVPAGVYLVSAPAGSRRLTGRVVLLR